MGDKSNLTKIDNKDNKSVDIGVPTGWNCGRMLWCIVSGLARLHIYNRKECLLCRSFQFIKALAAFYKGLRSKIYDLCISVALMGAHIKKIVAK